MKVSDCIISHLSFVKRQHTNGTYLFYRSHLSHFNRWCINYGIQSIEDLKFNVIDDYIFDMKRTCSNTTINKRIGILKRMIRHANIEMPYLLSIEKFKERTKTFEMLTRAQLKMINKYAASLPDGTRNNLMYKCLVLLLTDTGARINEIINIEKKNIQFDVDLGIILLTTTKMNRDRKVPFTQQSFSTVKKMMKHTKSEYLFYNTEKDRQMNYDDVRYFMRYLKSKLDIELLHPHMFRHSMATIWIEGGADLKSVMLVLGHENMKTTDRYLHNSMDHIKKTYLKKFKI